MWITANSLAADWLNDRVFTIDGKKYLCVLSKAGKLFNEAFEIILDNQDAQYITENTPDFYCFDFGGKVYYSPVDSSKARLNSLKYIGVAKDLTGFPYLGIHGGYELCNGSRVYEDWCTKAKFIGVTSLAIAERHTLAGALKFQEACGKAKIKSIIGETITVKGKESEFKVKIYVADNTGWKNLLKIHKALNVDGNSTYIDETVLDDRGAGLYCVFSADTFLTDTILFSSIFWKFKKIFFQLDPAQFKAVQRDTYILTCLKNYFNFINTLGLALICDSYYLDKEDHKVKKILNFIGNTFEYQSEDQYFKSFEDVCLQSSEMFTVKGDDFAADVLQMALAGTEEIASGCDFKIRTGEIHLPKYELSQPEKNLGFQNSEELFWYLIDRGLEEKVSQKGKDLNTYCNRVAIEADVIVRGGFVDYFLIIRDIINWCEENDILVGTGRGSVGGSIIAYLLNVTKVDAIEYDLLFERFLNESRIGKGLPDIDTDFESGRRNDVKRYIEDRYGKDNVCSIGTYNTLQLKAAFGDMLRFHGEQPQNIRFYSAMISESNDEVETLFYDAAGIPKLKEFVDQHFKAVNDLALVLGQAKSSSIHAAGIVITPVHDNGEPMQIYDWFPCKMADGVLVSEWEGPQLDGAGFLKADILGLNQLDKLHEMYNLIKERENIQVNVTQFMNDIDLQDADVFDLFKKGLNQDVFQFGTDGLLAYCREVKPESVHELAAINALYRPGPMESGAHIDYVKIKFGKKKPEYDYGTEEITKGTYSLMIYQEEVMQVCVSLAGFTLTQADDVRKAMGKKIPEKLKAYQEKFVDGAIANGCPVAEAHKIWNKLVAFAGYGFNKSHAVAYSVIGYQSQWFKQHYPMAFWTVSLGWARDEEVAKRISEMRKFDKITVSPPDINKSEAAFVSDWENSKIYWSLSKIDQVGEVTLKSLEEERAVNGKYFSIEEFVSRIKGKKINKKVVRNLVLTGCFDELYNIDFAPKRIDLINEHCKLIGEDLPEEFQTHEIYKEFFWFKRQRDLSGFGFFDYETTLVEMGFPGFECLTPEQISLTANEGVDGFVSGILVEVIKRKTKKGEMGKLTIDHNNDLVDFVVWNDRWAELSREIEPSVGKGIVLRGKVLYDNYNKKNVVYSYDKTEVEIF